MTPGKAALLTIALALPAALVQAQALAAPPRAVPVEVGGSEEWDACGSTGRVRGLKADGDGFLAVRAGPGADYAMLDKLATGAWSICGSRGRWTAVVYAPAGADASACGVSWAIAEAEVYRGPCKSGWVNTAWIEVVAG
ncbi:integron [Lysobacter enzymogenes]|nr:integron [Lysobacter enzymogenes]QCW27021.1 integron [Lysobacter enzymogenes]